MKQRRFFPVALCLILAVAAMVTGAAAAANAANPAARSEQGAKKKEPARYTIEELYKKGAELDKQQVVIHGRAVKVTSGIMGKTWTHIQDGSGDKAKRTNDMICISKLTGAAVGDVVTVKGTVAFHTEGMYRLVIEDATFLP